jgi:hypothetical protein
VYDGNCSDERDPSTEICNGIDDDCNGVVDDHCATVDAGVPLTPGLCRSNADCRVAHGEICLFTVPGCSASALGTCVASGTMCPSVGPVCGCNGITESTCASLPFAHSGACP